jgi:hypothetical protein
LKSKARPARARRTFAHRLRTPFAWACALACALAFAAEPAPPAALNGVRLVELDATLGIAVLRGAGGEHRAVKAGDSAPDGSYKVTRVLADRIEIEAPGPKSAPPPRFWLWKSAPGDTSPRLVALSREPPAEAPPTMTIRMTPDQVPGALPR